MQAMLETCFSQKTSAYAFLSYETFPLEDYIFFFILATQMAGEYVYFLIYSILKYKYKNLKTVQENKILACDSVKILCKITVNFSVLFITCRVCGYVYFLNP